MNSKLARDFSLSDSSFVHGSSEAHLLPSVFGIVMTFASLWVVLSILLVSICCVFLGRSDKQMIRVGAKAVIARMANAFTFGDWTFIDQPRRAMRGNMLIGSASKFAVSVGSDWPEPTPAISKMRAVWVYGTSAIRVVIEPPLKSWAEFG